MSEVTQILQAIEQGDPHAADKLLPLVYEELRRLAAWRLTHETPGQTLSATALVHEAYLRLVGPADANRWEGRGHFVAAAAEAMRLILVDRFRRKQSQKRGGGRDRDELNEINLASPAPREELLAVHEALDRLAATDAEAAELVKLRYFVGMSIPEAAAALGISPRTADRVWAYARAFLQDAIGEP